MPISRSVVENEEPAWVGDVLRFWFEELGEAQWFVKSDVVDTRIRERFFALHGLVLGQGAPATGTPRTSLAAVIVLDQFSRNMFRGSPGAYAADPLARRLARLAVDQGHDQAVVVRERLFFYLPFEHSEDRQDQQLSLRLITALGNDGLTRYAAAHQEIIDRFGRFPHRNAVLGRISTAEEITLLQEPANWF